MSINLEWYYDESAIVISSEGALWWCIKILNGLIFPEEVNSLLLCLAEHPYFVGVQYHPEYLTRPMEPSAPYLGLILAACNKLPGFIARGCQLSPRASYDYGSDEELLDDEVTQAFGRLTTTPQSSGNTSVDPHSE